MHLFRKYKKAIKTSTTENLNSNYNINKLNINKISIKLSMVKISKAKSRQMKIIDTCILNQMKGLV